MNCKAFVTTSIICILTIIFISFPLKVFATGYGEGSYSGGNYNEGEVVSTPTPSPENTTTNTTGTTNTSSNNSSTLTPGCSNSVTRGTPNLFEIQTTKDTATVYFSPPTAPYSSFYIAYSSKSDYNEYGVEYNQGHSDGALKYTIKSLKPNTKYYFKIRAGNGCATGNWGNTMSANTTNNTTQTKIYYKNILSTFVQQIKTAVKNILPSQKATNAIITPTINPENTATPTPKPAVTQNKHCLLWWCL
jgi:hypothetical protein